MAGSTRKRLGNSCILLIVIAGMERFAYKGVASNLITYLTDVVKMSNSSAAKTVNRWCGFTSMVPLLIAPLADSYWDRYYTIVASCFIYVAGLVALTSTALMSRASSDQANKTSSSSFLFCSLYLISLGQGGYNPSLQAFGADQLDSEEEELPSSKDDKKSNKKSLFFQWWYFGICSGTVLGISVMSYIQDTFGWILGFAIPMISMVTSVIVFSCGSPIYTYRQRNETMGNKPVVSMLQVIKAAALKLLNSKVKLPDGNDVTELELQGKPLCRHQNLSSNEGLNNEHPKSSIHMFENAKVILRLLPIWLMLLMFAVIFHPIFCKCPTKTQSQNNVSYLVSYVFQPSDNLSTVASRFGVQTDSIVEVNGNNTQPFDTIFIPVTQLPELSQPTVFPSPPSPPGNKTERKGVITGLAVGLGITGFLLILAVGVLIFGGGLVKKRRGIRGDEERNLNLYKNEKGDKRAKEMEVSLMADVSDCLDKYRVFGIEELREATNGFGENCLIEGSVYKGNINGEVYAIKKMKWNACEELKILQKVNHGNLVKLEGFCIDPEDANCYLVYEYVENGSLYSWLHENPNEKLSWKTRLHIAADVANGLQYIHEHTRPRVVHKDIKSSNILLDSNMRAKIANFGLAKSGCNAITMHIVGTQGYIAPEYLTDGVVSTKMDVFSFGVVLLELLSGKEAIDEAGNILWASAGRILEGSEEQKAEKLKQWVDKELFLESCSMESIVNVATVAIACLHKDPSKRPSMVDIVYALCKSDELFFDISDDGSSAPPVRAR